MQYSSQFNARFIQRYKPYYGLGSVVGIATAYGLDGPRIESGWGRDFPHLSRPVLRPTQPPVKWVPGLFHTLLQETMEPAEMRITRLWPNTDWATVWENLHTAPAPGTTKAVWYRILHDIIPTNERLHKIGISSTDRCRQCDKKDTKQHCLIECGNGEIV